jgi:hypothetical protein
MKKSYSFYCKNLNSIKYNSLLEKAKAIRSFKNDISGMVCSDMGVFLSFANKQKHEWITYFRPYGPSLINNQDTSNAITDVFTSYETKLEKLKHNAKISIHKSIP